MPERRSDRSATPPPEVPDETHVPPEAEDFYHVLKRLAAEKEDRRARNPGLYS